LKKRSTVSPRRVRRLPLLLSLRMPRNLSRKLRRRRKVREHHKLKRKLSSRKLSLKIRLNSRRSLPRLLRRKTRMKRRRILRPKLRSLKSNSQLLMRSNKLRLRPSRTLELRLLPLLMSQSQQRKTQSRSQRKSQISLLSRPTWKK